MGNKGELVVHGLSESDVAIFTTAGEAGGLEVLVMSGPSEMRQKVRPPHPVAAVLGIGGRGGVDTGAISLLRFVRRELPVIVVADEDSLELERSAREAGIFYYFVSPLDPKEVKAVVQDVLRQRRSSGGNP